MAKDILYAVHDNDLVGVLKRLKLLDEMESGLLRCKCCNKEINLDNLGGIVLQEGAPVVICDDIICSDLLEEKNVSE